MVTPITVIAPSTPPEIVVDESDLGKIGFTVDVAMRLTAARGVRAPAALAATP